MRSVETCHLMFHRFSIMLRNTRKEKVFISIKPDRDQNVKTYNLQLKKNKPANMNIIK